MSGRFTPPLSVPGRDAEADSRFQQQHPHPQQHSHQAQLYAQNMAQNQVQARTTVQQQQEKHLLNILSQQQRGGMNSALAGGVSTGGLGGVVARSIGGVDPRAQVAAAAAQAAVVSGEGVIRDVWSENLEDEMNTLRNLVDRYPYIAMVGCCAVFGARMLMDGVGY